ncbi:unnamed protein product, partial [Mesorhabditis spiculigera]
MYKLLSFACLLAICQAARVYNLNSMPHIAAGGRHKRDISLAVAGSCIVTGDQLFANGYLVRTLTSDEQNAVSQYQDEIQQLKDTRQQLQLQLKNMTMRRMRQQNLTPQEQSALQQLRNLTIPDAPAFCSGNDTTLYIFDGCMVQNDKVYVGSNYARDLTSDETDQLNTFLQQIDSYLQYSEQAMKQKMDQFANNMMNNYDDNMDNDNSINQDTQDSTNSPMVSTTQGNAPAFPKTPQFCTSF